ncbi:MAG: response regulator [Burkholderiales bacterium]
MASTLNFVHPSEAERSGFAGAMATAAAAVRTFATAEQFLRSIAAEDTGCVVVPSDLPGAGTRALIDAVRARHRRLRVVVLGGSADLATAVELVRAGADEYLAPPVSTRRLRLVIRQNLATPRI